MNQPISYLKIVTACLLCSAIFLTSCTKTNTVIEPSNSDNTYFSAISLNGVDQKITIPNTALNLSSGNFTIEAICGFIFNGKPQWVIDKSTKGKDIDYLLGIDSAGRFHFATRGSAVLLTDTVTKLVSGRYYHVAAVVDIDANKATLYVNGYPTASDTVSGKPTDVAHALNLGARNTAEYGLPSENWAGVIDEVRFWQIVRTQPEIFDNMNKRLFGTEAGLLLYIPFDEGTGNVAHDLTANHHDGTFVNNPTWVNILNLPH